MKAAIVIASCEFDVTGIHFRPVRAYIGGMQHTLDMLEIELRQRDTDWRAVLFTAAILGVIIGVALSVFLPL